MKRFGWIAVALMLAGCPAGWSDLCDDGACDGADSGSPDVAADVLPDVAGCDPTKELKDSPKCIDDALGIFVSPTGADTNPGTKSSPVQTIGKALALGGKARIYVCEGTYTGSVDVTKAVAIYGGLKCDWTPSSATHPLVVADKSAYAVKVTAPNVSVIDVDVQGKDGAAPGESSVGIFAEGASLTLRRCNVTAGKGVSASKPGDIADFVTRAEDGKGGDAGAGGGLSGNVACANGTGTSVGGAGGAPSGSGADGANGDPFGVYPVNPPGSNGGKGVSAIANCGGGSTGQNGSYGPGGGAGTGATKLGTLSSSGWAPAGGGNATAGKVGQGGGGGASLDLSGGAGGGGVGGCGGAAGQGGAGGGASVALLLLNTPGTLVDTKLVAKNAGDGAQGGTGQKAQEGGFSGGKFGGACDGGKGGHGGSGGGGGGGAGGISAGVLYAGTAPTIDGTSTPTAATLPSVTLGTAGAAGAAGQGGPPFKTTNPASNGGASGTAGVPGVAQAVLQAP